MPARGSAFFSGEFAAAAAQAAAAAPELRDVVLAAIPAGVPDAPGDACVRCRGMRPQRRAFPAGISVTSLDEVIAHGSRYGDRSPYATWADSAGLWLYTSGTTGTAKGAVHRHANIRYVAETYPREVLGIESEDRCYSVAKLFFAYGLGNSAFFPLAAGGTTILDPARPTPALVAQRLATYQPTLFFAVPSFYAALLAADVPADALASVRLAASAGETLPAGIYQRFRDRFQVRHPRRHRLDRSPAHLRVEPAGSSPAGQFGHPGERVRGGHPRRSRVSPSPTDCLATSI